MLFWLALVLMTGAAVLAVLWPLSRARETEAARDADIAVYRDQLHEIERDRARGVLPEAEAEAARVEVSRRLLAADARPVRTSAPGALYRRRIAAVIALAGIPLFALGIYAAVGSPGMPDAPLSARLAKPPEQQDIALLVKRIEAHLAQNPNDARGWEVLAPVYLRMGRAADAVKARENILRLAGSNAVREADLGEALVAAQNGLVDAQARAAFARALAHDPKNAKAKFYLDLAAKQQAEAGKR
jgi:cytochrome c-type biogenesis protein CcmH